MWPFHKQNEINVSILEDVERLIKLLEEDDNGDVRKQAARRLGEIGDARAVEPLCRALGDNYYEPSSWEHGLDPGYVVRDEAAEALKKIGSSAVEPLRQALGSANPTVCNTAALILGQIADARAVKPLCQALEDGVYYAAEALSMIRDPEAIEPLCLALEFTDWGVRWRAARTLGNIGDARAVDPLCRVLRDTVFRMSSEAAEALVKIGIPAVEPLCQMLGDWCDNARGKAAWALGRIGDARGGGAAVPCVGG